MNSPGCVFPVAAADALAWAAGRLNDSDLLLRAPLVPEAVFLGDLPDRASYRSVLNRVKYWQAAGAVFMVCRTGNPVVDGHLEKNTAMRVHQDTYPGGLVKYRYVLPPESFARWIKRWSRNTGRSINVALMARTGPSPA